MQVHRKESLTEFQILKLCICTDTAGRTTTRITIQEHLTFNIRGNRTITFVVNPWPNTGNCCRAVARVCVSYIECATLVTHHNDVLIPCGITGRIGGAGVGREQTVGLCPCFNGISLRRTIFIIVTITPQIHHMIGLIHAITVVVLGICILCPNSSTPHHYEDEEHHYSEYVHSSLGHFLCSEVWLSFLGDEDQFRRISLPNTAD